jgi:hypothetical protein
MFVDYFFMVADGKNQNKSKPATKLNLGRKLKTMESKI